VHPPPEGGALSPELRGRNGKVISSADVNYCWKTISTFDLA